MSGADTNNTTDGSSSHPIPMGWILKNQRNGLYYYCADTKQQFFSYGDLMRYVNYAEKAKVGIYAPTLKAVKQNKNARKDSVPPTKLRKKASLTVRRKPSPSSKSKSLTYDQSMNFQPASQNGGMDMKEISGSRIVSEGNAEADFQPSKTELEVVHSADEERKNKKSKSRKQKKEYRNESGPIKSRKKAALSVQMNHSSSSQLKLLSYDRSMPYQSPPRYESPDDVEDSESTSATESNGESDYQPTDTDESDYQPTDTDSDTEVDVVQITDDDSIEKKCKSHKQKKEEREDSFHPKRKRKSGLSIQKKSLSASGLKSLNDNQSMGSKSFSRNEISSEEEDSESTDVSDSSDDSDDQLTDTEVDILNFTDEESIEKKCESHEGKEDEEIVSVPTKLEGKSGSSVLRTYSPDSNSKLLIGDQSMIAQSTGRIGSIDKKEDYEIMTVSVDGVMADFHPNETQDEEWQVPKREQNDSEADIDQSST